MINILILLSKNNFFEDNIYLCSSEPFIMPDVDFNVCSIEELKLFELSSIFSREMEEHSISEEDLIGLIKRFPKKDLTTNWINDLILKLIEQV